MNFLDLIRMSSGNLWRRKLRTFLTILGVIIGTASIVVMVSLGLALNKSTMEEMEKSGGLTTIQVYESGSFYDMSAQEETETDEQKRISDQTVEDIRALEHVTVASPVLSINIIAKQGRYMGYINLYGMDLAALEQKNLEFASGGLPEEGSNELQFIYGNQVLTNFSNEKTGEGYWDSGVMPDVDMEKPLYYILDSEAYWNSQYDTSEEGDTAATTGPPKKYNLKTAGVLAGDLETYTEDSYNVYCDIEPLLTQLKKSFKGRAIPEQPVTKSGKPYKEIYYNEVYVRIDDMNNAEAVQQQIKEMGYQPNWNAEWVQQQEKQYRNIQLVLGCIGAVSLFVAAIGIANTMMMSIYERTKEIGVIKVLGCSLSNIRTMFLLEASFIGFIGGVAGLGLSYGLSWVLNHFGSFLGEFMTGMEGGTASYIPPWLAGAALIFAVLVGMIAGFFPALRAMKLSPLAAIRTE